MFPGSLLPPNFPDPDNPDRLIGRSEVERRREYIQQLHEQLPERHPLVQLVHQCLHNNPTRRPSAEELLQQLEAVRAQIEGGPYGQLVSVNMEKLKMVRTVREKDTEIGQLQQQMQQLEVEVEAKDNQLQQQSIQLRDRDTQLQRQVTQLQERGAQINRQQTEIDALRVRNARQRCCVASCDVSICLLGGKEEATGGGGGEEHPTQREGYPAAATESRTPRKGHTTQQTTERATNTEGR